MFTNYLKSAFRNFKRFKTFSFINIFGLALGMAVSFVILLYVIHEFSYDKWNKNADRIFRVITKDKSFSTEQPNSPLILAPTLKKDFPEIEKIARVKQLGAAIKFKDKFTRVGYFVSADQEIFQILDITLTVGDQASILQEPFSVALSESSAKRYFGAENPLGEILPTKIYGKTYNLKVTGIFKDIPKNSTLQVNFISSIDINYQFYENIFSFNNSINPQQDWSILACSTYLLFPQNFNVREFASKLPAFVKQYQQDDRFSYALQSLKDIYLHSSNLINNHVAQGNLSNVYLFSAIAVLILIIAAINFVILSIARSATRIKEVGLRKVIGAKRFDLIKQIIFESMFLAIISLPLAVVFLEFLLPQLNHILGINLSINYFRNWTFIVSFLIITLVIGVLSGSYIAIYLSKFNPIEIFRTQMSSNVSRSWFRRVLIVVQVAIFVGLITSSIIVYKQLHFMENQYLGFNKKNLISISFDDKEIRNLYEAYKNEVANHTGILNISGASYVPPTDGWTRSSFPDPNDATKMLEAEAISVDYNFIETLGIKITEGRTFSKDFSTDAKTAVLLNQTAVKEFNIKNPIGFNLSKNRKIIGVMDDFHIHSFRQKIGPVLLSLQPQYVREMILRLDGNHIPETIDFLRKKWESIIPGKPFHFSFFDDSLAELYLSEQRFKKIMNYFTLFAIFIACLGLFGLASFMSKQRTKEIGIRKVLGASISSTIGLLSREFVVLTVIATLVACPISYFYISKWLQNFAYRTSVDLWIFVLAGFSAILITFVTISFQVVKTALVNPVESLKYE